MFDSYRFAGHDDPDDFGYEDDNLDVQAEVTEFGADDEDDDEVTTPHSTTEHGLTPPPPAPPPAAPAAEAPLSVFRNAARSPSRSACIIANTFGSGGGGKASPETSSGHSAPWSIQFLTISIWAALNGPVGGICIPKPLPMSLR